MPEPVPATCNSRNTFYSSQFVGMHEHLVITLKRPSFIDNLFHISDKVPEIKPFGRTIWLGTCRYGHSNPRSQQSGWVIEVPSNTCTVAEPHLRNGERISLKAILHNINKLKGIRREMLLLEFPSLPRQWFDVSAV